MNDNVRHIFGENIAAPDSASNVDRMLDRDKGRYSSAMIIGVDRETGILAASVSELNVPQALWLMEQFKFAILMANAPTNLGWDDDDSAA